MSPIAASQNTNIPPTPKLFELFLSFLKLGTVSFGGPAIVAYIRRLAVEEKKWLDEEAFADGLALCQSIPGAISVQTAIYVGLRLRGLRGALTCFAAYIFSPFLFMLTLSALYAQTHTVPLVASAFDGLRAIIIAILAHATVDFAKTYLKKIPGIFIALTAALLFGLKINPVLVIILAGLAGYFLSTRKCALTAFGYTADMSRISFYTFLMLLTFVALGFAALYCFDPQLFAIGLLMSKIDLFAFGGGYTAVPLIFHEIVEVRAWLDGKTLLDGIALGYITPGPIVLTATFVGYLLKGLTGALTATICIFLPSFLLVIGIMPYFDRLKTIACFNRITEGILCSFVGLLLSATVLFAMEIQWDVSSCFLGAGAFAALLLQADILWVVCAGVLISVLFF